MGNYEEAKSFVSTCLRRSPVPPITLMRPQVDCWRKNLQISKPRASTLSSRRRLPEVNHLLSIPRNPLTHPLRWIHWYGHRRRRRSGWCFAAHKLSKAGSAQIIPIYNRSSNAVAFVMLSRCSRTECLSPRTLSTSRHSSPCHTKFSLAQVLQNKSLLTLHTRCVRVLQDAIM
jgi:hypothetical protein